MKKYIAPEVDVSKFNAEEVLTVSVSHEILTMTEEKDGALSYTKDLPKYE